MTTRFTAIARDGKGHKIFTEKIQIVLAFFGNIGYYIGKLALGMTEC